MTTYLKHEEIIKFLATKKCDIRLDSPLKVWLTLKISTSYLLPSSRMLTKTVYVDIPETCRDYRFLGYHNV